MSELAGMASLRVAIPWGKGSWRLERVARSFSLRQEGSVLKWFIFILWEYSCSRSWYVAVDFPGSICAW